MDRKQFLEICQRVSVLPDDVSGTKRNITPDLIVNFDCMRFYPVGYQITFNQGKIKHTAILHDLKCASVIYCDLERVTINEKE